jgi:hypothetical protein
MGLLIPDISPRVSDAKAHVRILPWAVQENASLQPPSSERA